MHILEPRAVFQGHFTIQGTHPTTNEMLRICQKVYVVRGGESREFVHDNLQQNTMKMVLFSRER